MKPVYRRRAAQEDIEAAIHFYLTEAGEQVALGFTDAVESAVQAVRNYPDSGSARIGQESGYSSLRSRRTNGYPYLVFYWVVENRVEILRVLHSSRDLPNILSKLED